MSYLDVADLIRVPMPDGTYRQYPLLTLLGATHSQLQSASGFGMPPIRIIEQRGPLQHGSTLLDFRYDNRIIQVVIVEQLRCILAQQEVRWDMVDLLRPSRLFPAASQPTPLIYRRWLAGGMVVRGHDLVLTAGSDEVQSITARFAHYGLRAGSRLTISGSAADDGTYAISEVNHDGRVTLGTNMTNDETGIGWEFRTEPAYRDLYCICELGPQFDRGDQALDGYSEVLRFVANDPFWYGAEQSQSWAIPNEFENLVFDYGSSGVAVADAGAAFGATPGTERWLFADSFVSDDIAIPYWGHEGAVPVITITGPAEDTLIKNNPLASQISFNYAVGAGEVVTIDTLNLTATNAAGDDLFMYLTGDVSGFIISQDAANDRVNTLTVEFSGAAPTSAVNLTWRNRYGTI